MLTPTRRIPIGVKHSHALVIHITSLISKVLLLSFQHFARSDQCLGFPNGWLPRGTAQLRCLPVRKLNETLPSSASCCWEHHITFFLSISFADIPRLLFFLQVLSLVFSGDLLNSSSGVVRRPSSWTQFPPLRGRKDEFRGAIPCRAVRGENGSCTRLEMKLFDGNHGNQ